MFTEMTTAVLFFIAVAVIIEFIYTYQDYMNRSSVAIRVKRKYVKRTPEQKAADKARVRRAYHKNPNNPRWAN